MSKYFYVRQTGGAAVLVCSFLAANALSVHQALGQLTQINGAQTRMLTNLQTGNAYTVAASDCGKLLSLSNASDISVTIPQAGASGLNSGCWIDIQNTGTGTVTLSATPSLIDGAATVQLTTNQGLRLVSNGAAYFTQRGQGSSGDSALSIQSGGVPIGTASTLNVVAGAGVACIPQVNSNVMTLQCNADTSYLATRVDLQSASNPQICTSDSDDGAAYTASCAMALTAYAARQTLYWYTDVTNSGPATLDIDMLGVKNLVDQKGNQLVAGQINAATLYRIWYDGDNIRVAELGGIGGGDSTGGTNNSSSIGDNGYYFPFGYPSDGGGTYTASTSNLEAVMFVPSVSMTVKSLIYDVIAETGCSPCGIAFGFYDASGNQLSQTTTTFSETGSAKVTLGSPQTLTAGSVYYFAWAADNNTVTLQAAGSGSWLFSVFSTLDTSTVRSGTPANTATGTGSGLLLPSTLGTISARSNAFGVPPCVMFLM